MSKSATDERCGERTVTAAAAAAAVNACPVMYTQTHTGTHASKTH